MDRLHALTIAVVCVLGLPACDEGKEAAPEPAEPSSRFVAVAKTDEGRSPEAFCDAYTPGEGASTFEPPPTAGDAEMPGDGWRWVNVWATWCKPCIEEMPLLDEWKGKLEKEGADFELVFLSVDENDQVVTDYRAEHPQTPESLRIESMDALPDFLASVGLDENTPIPIQVFVDPEDRIRCVRAGAVNPPDYSAVKKILL